MLTEKIKNLIEQSLPNSQVFVMDPLNDGQHLQAIVVCPAFEGLMLVKQHQLVMKPLKSAFENAVHALAIKTFTPAKWALEKSQYGF